MFLFRQRIILFGFYCLNFHQKRRNGGNRRQIFRPIRGVSCLIACLAVRQGRQVGGRFDFFILPGWKIRVWRIFCFVCRRLALLQKFMHPYCILFIGVHELAFYECSVVHPEGCVLLQMCQTRVGQKM